MEKTNLNKENISRKYISYEDVLEMHPKSVTILSYGYEEISVFGTHFEPFRNKRSIMFTVNKVEPVHKWLYFSNDPREETWYIEDNIIYCDDPELYTRE